MHRPRWLPLASAWMCIAVAALACAPAFKLTNYHGNEALYKAGIQEYTKHHWDNAIQAFEKLTLELPARDTLLPRSHYFLAMAHERQGEHLLAAQSFTRLYESFPDDTLADDALYEAGRSYERLWRRPELDAQYGSSALVEFQTLTSAYPDSPLAKQAAAQIDTLNEWFAEKDYKNGMHYYHRKAYDSAIIYFKDVVRLYPATKTLKDAYLRLAEAYRAIRYREDVAETCATLYQKWPSDREVRDVCGPPRVAADSTRKDTTARRDTTRRIP